MTRSTHNRPIFHYAIEIQGREFLLVVTPDGMSQWDDHTERRSLRHPRDQYLELWAFGGNQDAFRRLQNERLEFTISAPVPEHIVAKAMEMARQESKRGIAPPRVAGMRRRVAEMDDLLTNYFWKEINPLLSQPINSGPR